MTNAIQHNINSTRKEWTKQEWRTGWRQAEEEKFKQDIHDKVEENENSSQSKLKIYKRIKTSLNREKYIDNEEIRNMRAKFISTPTSG